MRMARNVHAVDADDELVCELPAHELRHLPGRTWASVHPAHRCETCHLMVGGHSSEFGIAVAV